MRPQRVVILVPRRAGKPDRDRLWAFTREWWARDFPDWPITEGHHDDGPFNRSAAINAAADAAGRWDIAVIIDADVLCNADSVRLAVETATRSKVMVVAGQTQIHLTPQGTSRILDGFRGSWESRGFIETIYREHWSSCVVVSRSLWDEVGGFDPLFTGWGYEDNAFRFACETVSGVGMIRTGGTIWHLHHATSTDGPATKLANRVRAERYRLALGNRTAMQALIDEAHRPPPPAPKLGKTVIPRILHRTVPATVDARAEQWWERFRVLHPGWKLMTHRDPLPADEWPELGDLWGRCANGAQRAGLIRLEALWRWGGVYVDSDVEPYRSLEPLLHLPGFSAWEDANCAPDAVLGAKRGHPALSAMISLARCSIIDGGSAWDSGPGVTTAVLPGRSDWLVLPPGSFFPVHYKNQQALGGNTMAEQPWAFCCHWWNGSWLTPAQRQANKAATASPKPLTPVQRQQMLARQRR